MQKSFISKVVSSVVLVAALLGSTTTTLALSPGPLSSSSSTEPSSELWEDYWKAKSDRGRGKVADRLLAAGVTVDEALAELRRGRTFDEDVATGLGRRSHVVTGGLQHPYAIVIPESYSPSRAHSVVVYLHGGVQRPPVKRNERWWPEGFETADDGEIVVVPAAWSESVWWQKSQVESISGILEDLNRIYNIDENRVALMGVSDGGTGAYFQAFRNTTPWASFVPLIGHSRVLGNPAVGADGEMFPINLSNKPLFVVNGANDRLYPSSSVAPYLDLFASAGADIEFRHQPDSGHDLRWWPEEADRMNNFLRDNPRDPLPDRLAWETERTDRYNRNHWLFIDKLGPVSGEQDLPPYDRVAQMGGGGGMVEAFPHKEPSGRVEAQRKGNTIATRCQGVEQFRLLLSPDEIDFEQPVRIGLNGQDIFLETLTPSVATLLHWAAQDEDRTMLFGAELVVDVRAGRVSVAVH